MMRKINTLFYLLLFLTSCSQNQPAIKPPPPKVNITKVQVKTMQETIQSYGQVIASKTVNIQPQVTGQLQYRFFKDGQMVNKGDLLYVIDPSLYKANLDQAYADYQKAQAELELALITEKRNRYLAENEYVSELDFDQMQTNVKTAKANLNASKANLNTAKINYSYCFIKAPISGRLSSHKQSIGNIVVKDNTVMTSLNKINPVHIEFSLSDIDFEKLPKQKTYPCKLTTQLGETIQTQVFFIDNHIDTHTATILLKSRLMNKENLFWPGQFVKLSMVARELKAVNVIPKVAVFFESGKQYVYIVENLIAQKKMITPLLETQTEMAVEGLNCQDSVVVSGQIKLHEGQKVSISSQLPTQEDQ